MKKQNKRKLSAIHAGGKRFAVYDGRSHLGFVVDAGSGSDRFIAVNTNNETIGAFEFLTNAISAFDEIYAAR